ncbi:glycosyltransferase [Vannielia litorea]|uniref:glycosyltransferase n=1 Tax=Vannielia litorea TaxID=1217970 RepID=UPI001FD3E326|nr:glycosyltransferase [Vannielia litorea]
MLQSTPEWRQALTGYEMWSEAPPVTVLMAVHRGAPHLPDQLDSLTEQQHKNWSLVVSIDGEDDGSGQILDTHPSAARITRITGPGKGAAANFLHLMRRVDPGNYWAFSDQDDVWLPHKLGSAVKQLENVPWNQPAMYHSRSLITDGLLDNHRMSPSRPKPPSFANALVQNIAGGNTIVLNPAASRLVHAAAHDVEDVTIHDWWLYQLITGAGGVVLHDEAPSLLYRQHGANLIGANDGMRARARRLRMVMDGTYKRWMETNIAALKACAKYFTPENRRILRRVIAARRQPLPVRMKMLRDAGIHRQTQFASSVMWLSVILGRF